jgi:hypothetical protein
VEAIAASTRPCGLPPQPRVLRRLLELGFDALAIHERLRGVDLEEMRKFIPRRGLGAISLFVPLPNTLKPGDPPPFAMASLDPEERRAAVDQGARTLEVADELEIPFVVVPPAVLSDPSPERAYALLSGKTEDRVWESLRQVRRPAAARHLDSYKSTLARLLDRADRYGRRLALTPAGLPHELPDLEEVSVCLREFSGAPLSLWPDLLRDARYRRSAGPAADRLRGDLAAHVRGIWVEDGDREKAHLPLGAGEVDLASWEKLVKGSATPGAPSAPDQRTWVIDLAPGTSEEEILETRGKLEKLLQGPEKAPFEPFNFGR